MSFCVELIIAFAIDLVVLNFSCILRHFNTYTYFFFFQCVSKYFVLMDEKSLKQLLDWIANHKDEVHVAHTRSCSILDIVHNMIEHERVRHDQKEII